MKKHKFYTDSQSAWTAMIDVISGAKRSVYLESYIFEDDAGPNYNFFERLTEKAKSGVRVRVVLDGFGSLYLSSELVEKLREAGGEVLFFNSWFRRIHRKILIVDEEVALIGGVNVGKKYIKWLDLHLKISIKSAVRALVKSFARIYFYCGGTDPHLLGLRTESKVRKTELWLLEHFPWMGKLMLRKYYEEQISGAKERIVLVTPYFVPHRWLISLLQAAKGRGVAVEVIVPENSDMNILTFANHVAVSSLAKTGIKFFMTKDMLHAKAILVDDKVGMVGSNNIDALSFDINAEASISFKRKEMVRDLKNIIEVWKRDAVPFKHNPADDTLIHRIAEKLVKLLQPIL